ncbi:MAG: L-threonylcarbamoyladenylate synthase [Armatimonadota bacterium]
MNKLKYYKIKSVKDDKKINAVAKELKNGAIIAMPTETVYGLFVNALDKDAVNRLFKIKERSLQKALAYHLASPEDIRSLVLEIPEYTEKLINKTMPGPIMLLFKKQKRVPDSVTGSSKKVGVRIPANEVTLEIIKRSGIPVAGSSANISGELSPTRPEHVLASFAPPKEQIDALVDTDQEPIGVESTILDVSTATPRILRMGFVSAEQIHQLTGIRPVLSINNEKEAGFPEFKPEGRIILVEGYTRTIILKIKDIVDANKDKKVLLVLTDESAQQFEDQKVIKMGTITSFEVIAKNIFSVLRTIETKAADLIIIEGILPANIGAVVMDKLRKVANEVVQAR